MKNIRMILEDNFVNLIKEYLKKQVKYQVISNYGVLLSLVLSYNFKIIYTRYDIEEL